MTPPANRLGIIAGGGQLPLDVARAAMAAGREVFVLAVDEFAEPVPEDLPHRRSSIGKLGWCLQTLRAQRCREVVFAGGFARPRDRNIRLRPDWGGLWFLLSNIGVLRRSNDGIHRAIATTFQRAGFDVISPLAAAPALAAQAGYLTQTRATAPDERLFAEAIAAARTHGATGQGQAVVVRGGEVLARESRAGTDAMLQALDAATARGAWLVKAMAPNQLPTMDPPAIGAHTVQMAARAGLAGLLVEARRSIIVQPAEVRAAADAAGLFVFGAETP